MAYKPLYRVVSQLYSGPSCGVPAVPVQVIMQAIASAQHRCCGARWWNVDKPAIGACVRAFDLVVGYSSRSWRYPAKVWVGMSVAFLHSPCFGSWPSLCR